MMHSQLSGQIMLLWFLNKQIQEKIIFKHVNPAGIDFNLKSIKK